MSPGLNASHFFFFFLFFDMSTQEGEGGFELVTSASWGIYGPQPIKLPLGDLNASHLVSFMHTYSCYYICLI